MEYNGFLKLLKIQNRLEITSHTMFTVVKEKIFIMNHKLDMIMSHKLAMVTHTYNPSIW